MKRRLEEEASQDFRGVSAAASLDARNARIGQAITELTSAHPGIWLAFSSTRREPLIPALEPSSKSRYAFPRMTADRTADDAAAKMHFHIWNGSGQSAWTEHRFGIREPDVSNESWTKVDLATVRGALIPGLGFDRCLHRLGRGAGFYDRFLKDSQILKVGVGFSVQLTDELPHESHDVELDALVTDREAIWRMTDSSALRARKVDAS
jgi:5-formyltetrahydrofolate cyclo-ligase